jgi:hypothetical protein
MLLLGEAGSGKTEALARRFVARGRRGAAERPQEILLVAATRATAERLRSRVEMLLEGPYEELWTGPGRRSPSACSASTPRRQASTPSSTSSAGPSGWRCCSTESSSCRCASHEIRATRPACWHGCSSGSTR